MIHLHSQFGQLPVQQWVNSYNLELFTAEMLYKFS